MESYLANFLSQSASAASALAQPGSVATLAAMAQHIATALRAGGKILIAGNGGSAADAQHIAAEFVSRLMFNRPPLAALALTESGPILTACGNDYGFNSIFARQLQALARPNDVFWGLSTSGNSPNLLEAAAVASALGLTTIGFAGPTGGAMAGSFSQILCAPAPNAQIIQQLHMAAAHAIIATVERTLFTPP